jgi:hypothetical protein
MITVKMDAKQMIYELKAVSQSLTKELGIAAWNTAKKGKSLIAKDVLEGQGLKIKQAQVKKLIIEKRNDGGPTTSSVQIKQDRVLPITPAMNPEQVSSGGQYKPTKKGGIETIKGAFAGPRPGVSAINLRGKLWVQSNQAKRVMKKGRYKGRMRTPIRPAGTTISPYAIHVKNNRQPIIVGELKDEMDKQIQRRIRFHVLKKQGTI